VKLLLDEHVSPRVAEALRTSGHGVVPVSESELLRGRSDEEMLERASGARQALVTHNFADFLKISADWAKTGREHFGVVLVPIGFQRRGVGAYVRALEVLLESHESDDALRGQVTWVSTS
jgi:predicted nuclease of predicted toxin-antitoxin system